MPFAQTCLVRSENQRHMSERWRLLAQRAIKLNLSGRIREMIVAANDVTDRHINVIHDNTKIISRRAVRPSDDEIVELTVVEYHFAFDGVVHDGCSIARRTKTDHIKLSCRQLWNRS